MIAGEHRLALPAGFQLGKYRFKEVLGAGGFGITYLADDDSLGRRVAIKELLPNDIATRLDGSTVVAKTKSEEDNLAWARDRFLKEGRALAACEHPNVVHVYEMVEANGTAYMVTKFEEGHSFAAWLKEIGDAPKEKELRGILLPLLSGLEKVHKAGFLHRDLKPENIYITHDGRPILLDFGSARQAINDRTTSLTSIVTSGYAPFEQYHEDGKQGAWTDLYAMAAVMYRAIHGKKPPEATRRLQDDPCVKLAREYAGKYSAPFLNAIDKALVVEPTKRPQTVADWKQMLGNAPAEDTIGADPKLAWDMARAQAWAGENPMLAAGLAAGALILILGAVKILLPSPALGPQVAAITPAPAPPPVVVTPAPTTPAPSTPVLAVVTPVPAPQPANPVPQAATPAPQPIPGLVQPIKGGFIVGPRPGQSWDNSLGQTYLPLPGTSIHMGANEVRVGDFETFVRATGYNATAGTLALTSKGWVAQGASWVKPGFPQTAQHPVVGLNAYDALEFCRWLTDKERAEGKIDQKVAYRLPTDDEWDKAVGGDRFPWGDAWPPPAVVGNYAGQEAKAFSASERMVPGYNDNFASTSPVRTFQANAAGFYDLGGNAHEICGSVFRADMNPGGIDAAPKENDYPVVLRGGSWMIGTRGSLASSARDWMSAQKRALSIGFRCVVAPAVEPPVFVLPPLPVGEEERPIAVADGEDVVDRKLVAVWEYKPANSSQAAIRWEQQADGHYSIFRGSEVIESGAALARAGRLQQVADGASGKMLGTYRLKTTTQLMTNGPLGEITWKRIKALPAPVNPPIAKRDSDEPAGGRSNDSQGSKPHTDPKPKPKPPQDVERRMKDIGNQIRRRLPF